MGHDTPEFQYRHALPDDRQPSDCARVVLALQRRSHDGASWNCPYEEHLKSKKVRSNQSLKKRILKMLTNIARLSEDYYNKNEKYMRDVGGGMWELKPKSHRLLMFMDDVNSFSVPCWLIVDAFKKPKPKKQNSIIENSKYIMQSYFRWKG